MSTISKTTPSIKTDSASILPVFFVLTVLFSIIILSRWDAMTLDYELNPDESSFAAQGLRILNGAFVPWGNLEAGSSSALTPAFIAVAFQLGLPTDFLSLHLLATALVCITLFALFLIARLFLEFWSAAAIIFSISISVALARTPDFVHLAGELLPNCFLSFSLYFLLKACSEGNYRISMAATGAALVGLTPFIKLQYAPLAVAIVSFAALEAFLVERSSLPKKLAKGVTIGLASALPGILLLTWVAANGAFPDFINNYLLSTLSWSPSPESNSFYKTIVKITYTGFFGMVGWTAISMLLFSLVGINSLKLRFNWTEVRPWVFALIVLAAALYSVARPLRSFPHHQWILLPAFSLIAILAARTLLARLATRPGNISFLIFTVALLAPIAGLTERLYRLDWNPLVYHRLFAENPARSSLSIITHRVKEVAPDAQSLFVWGWTDGLYMTSGLRSISKFTCTVFLIEDYTGRDRMRSELLDEIAADPPDVIVDAVAKGMFGYPHWNEEQRIGMFSGLNTILQKEYRIAFEQTLIKDQAPVRIYVRRGNAAADGSGNSAGVETSPEGSF